MLFARRGQVCYSIAGPIVGKLTTEPGVRASIDEMNICLEYMYLYAI